MRFGKRQPFRKYLQSKFGIAVLLLIVFFLGKSVFERFVMERDMAERRAEAEAELKELESRKSALEEDVRYLEGERGIEEEIRSNFDVARSGEQVVILTGESEASTTPAPAAEAPAPWWQFWR